MFIINFDMFIRIFYKLLFMRRYYYKRLNYLAYAIYYSVEVIVIMCSCNSHEFTRNRHALSSHKVYISGRIHMADVMKSLNRDKHCFKSNQCLDTFL